MVQMTRRTVLGIEAVLDVALYARHGLVSARDLAQRLGLQPRQLEPILQKLVQAGILKGLRGPKGGYELARERRRITLSDIMIATDTDHIGIEAVDSSLHGPLVKPALQHALQVCVQELRTITIESMVADALKKKLTIEPKDLPDYTI